VARVGKRAAADDEAYPHGEEALSQCRERCKDFRHTAGWLGIIMEMIPPNKLIAWGLALLLIAPRVATAQAVESKTTAARHPNLLLNSSEIEQVKVKVREHPWAARLLEKVRAKAENDGPALETALAFTLTGETKFAERARRKLLREAREQMPHYEKIDVNAEPEWGRWTFWGAVAWAYDLVYDTFSAEERMEIEEWLRIAARTIIAQENVLTTTPNLVFCEHWRVGMIGYCLGDSELIEWALRDPGKHGASRGGFYQVMETMIRDEQFWAEAPIYALHYDVHGMFALAEAALRFDGTNLYEYVSPKSGASLKKIVDGYLRMAFPLERSGSQGGGTSPSRYIWRWIDRLLRQRQTRRHLPGRELHGGARGRVQTLSR
jgi:hypothetical protein